MIWLKCICFLFQGVDTNCGVSFRFVNSVRKHECNVMALHNEGLQAVNARILPLSTYIKWRRYLHYVLVVGQSWTTPGGTVMVVNTSGIRTGRVSLWTWNWWADETLMALEFTRIPSLSITLGLKIISATVSGDPPSAVYHRDQSSHSMKYSAFLRIKNTPREHCVMNGSLVGFVRRWRKDLPASSPCRIHVSAAGRLNRWEIALFSVQFFLTGSWIVDIRDFCVV